MSTRTDEGGQSFTNVQERTLCRWGKSGCAFLQGDARQKHSHAADERSEQIDQPNLKDFSPVRKQLNPCWEMA
jgi:hypothetical protein